MATTTKTFNGHTLNSSSYRARILNANALPAAISVFIDEAQADAVDAGTYTVEARDIGIHIRIIDYVNRYTLLDQLKGWLKRGTRGLLVATLEDGADYQLDCRVKNLVQDNNDPWVFTALLVSGNTAWRAVTADTAAWDVSATGGSHTIAVAGSDETRLNVVLTATANPTLGYLYQNLVQLINVPLVNYGLWKWCIALDTAALVSAGKMQADGDDLRVFVDGKEVNRWLADINTNHTHIWFNTTLGFGYSLTTRTAIAGSGTITSIDLAQTASMLAALKAMPASGILVRGTEWIAYSGKDLVNYKLTVTQRGTQGTTMQAHGAGSVFSFMEHAIMLYYGNSVATAPALSDSNYDLTKPCFNLSSSDNTRRVGDATTLFSGDWQQVITKIGNLSKLYTIKGDADSGDPALGISTTAWYRSGGSQMMDMITMGWKYYNPGGIQTITMTGRKYRNTANWIVYAGLQRSVDGATWISVFSEAMPLGVSFEAWAAHSGVAIDSTSKYLFVTMTGYSSPLFNMFYKFELLTYTIEFTTANIPALTLLGERLNFTLNVRVQNDSYAGAPALDLSYIMQLNKAFTLDGEAYTADYDKVNAHGAVALDNANRSVWIPLVVGNNIITVVSADCGTLHVAASWYKRRL